MHAPPLGMDERRLTARRHVELDPGLKPGLPAELLRRGLVVRPRAGADRALPAAGLLVDGGVGSRLDAAIDASEAAAARGPSPRTLVLLISGATEAQALRAAALTPFVHSLDLAAAALASLVEAAETISWRLRPRRSRVVAQATRTACIRLGESVEVDGCPIPLGVAERNFLFALAARPGAWLAKDGNVDVGADRAVAARECRRRLGKRLGADLASLLVPDVRGEPYRLREPAELEGLASRGGPSLRLRIVGRCGVSLRFLPRLDGFGR